MTPMQARALVSTIDLAAIATKVRIQQTWDAGTITRAEGEYREYLTAALAEPAFAAPPSKLADEIWHAHVLGTAKYAADCQRVFGTFIEGKRAVESDEFVIKPDGRHHYRTVNFPIRDAEGCIVAVGGVSFGKKG